MLLSLALIFLLGLSLASIFKLIKLPRLIGLLATGIILGPYVLDLIDPKILNISAELRKIALIIILIKAGLSLDIKKLKEVGASALLLSFLPATFEIVACLIFAPIFFNLTYVEALLLGSVLAAVSPAVVVPKMTKLMDTKLGTNNGIPELILAGASLDDVFVIVLFSVFLEINNGEGFKPIMLLNIPSSIILGILLGSVVGFILYIIFEALNKKNLTIHNSIKVLLILSISFLFVTLESALDGIVSISGLLAVMSLSIVLGYKMDKNISKDLTTKYSKLWLCFEILLFSLVGALVDIKASFNYILPSLGLLSCTLLIRSIGTFIAVLPAKINMKEKIFVVISYLPKATVQAAIGGIPLSIGLPSGEIILSVSVLAIIITAPLGAILMDIFDKRLLEYDCPSEIVS